jgi:8-oxo-dGTP diphosphatase
MNESWEYCAEREVKEETNLEVIDLKFAHVTNDIMVEEKKHYVTIFMMGRPVIDTDVPVNLEPDKCEGWEIYQWEALKEMAKHPSNSSTLFGPFSKLLLDEPPAVLEYLRQS